MRERVRVNGQMPGKDSWASATRLLYDRTREFGEQGLGGFSKYEAMTVVAAHLFAEGEVDFSIFEVGLGGRYDATNAWDSEIAVLTSIALDHTDVLGDTLLQIAAEKVEIARPGKAPHHHGVSTAGGSAFHPGRSFGARRGNCSWPDANPWTGSTALDPRALRSRIREACRQRVGDPVPTVKTRGWRWRRRNGCSAIV